MAIKTEINIYVQQDDGSRIYLGSGKDSVEAIQKALVKQQDLKVIKQDLINSYDAIASIKKELVKKNPCITTLSFHTQSLEEYLDEISTLI
jgi:hypothetical protein